MNLHKIENLRHNKPILSAQHDCHNGATEVFYTFKADGVFGSMHLILLHGRVLFVLTPISAHTAVAISFDGNYQALYDMFERKIQEGR